MPSSIASLKDVSNALDTGAKFIRLMSDEGVTVEQFRLPIDKRDVRRRLAAYMKAGCPAITLPKEQPAEPPKPELTIIDLGILEVNCKESIAQKLAGITDKKMIGWRTGWATDEKFPDARTGIKRYKASAVCFHQTMGQEAIEMWCGENKKILGLPKDGIELAKLHPRPELDDLMPLAMAGQFFVRARGGRGALDLARRGVDGRSLLSVWLGPGEGWGGRWFFLVLEELPS